MEIFWESIFADRVKKINKHLKNHCYRLDFRAILRNKCTMRVIKLFVSLSFFSNKIVHRISDLKREKFSRIRGRSFFPRNFFPWKYFHGESKKKLISAYVIYINFLLSSLSQHLYQFKLFHIIFPSPTWFHMEKHFS